MSEHARSSSPTPVASGPPSPKAPSSPASLKRKHIDVDADDEPTPKPKSKPSHKGVKDANAVEDLDDGVGGADPPPRDEEHDEDDSSPPKCNAKNSKDAAGGDLPQEYEKGLILCPSCGIHVNIRDETTGGFTVDMWEEHRERCFTSSSRRPSSSHPSLRPSLSSSHPLGRTSNFVYTPESGLSGSGAGNADSHGHIAAPPKRRRAKRTEEERIEYLRADPYVAQFEAYRVLCASCDKWIRLRPNSTYCSIPWDAHRKSCLAKKINNKNAYALEERNLLFSKDPDIRKFDAERLLCNRCDSWLTVSPDDHLHAVQRWLEHRATCDKVSSHPPSSSHPSHPSHYSHHPSHPSHQRQPASSSRRPQVPPLSQSHMALASSSLPSGSSTAVERSPASVSPRSGGGATFTREGRDVQHRRGGGHARVEPPWEVREVRGWNDLTPATFSHPHRSLVGPHTYPAPSSSAFPSLSAQTHASHESRRRNAEQRAATLRADALIGAVEANRVFCTLCSKWVQLRQDSSFCAYPWVQHRGKCLKRWERRRGVEGAGDGDVDNRQGELQNGNEEDELASEDGSSADGREHAGNPERAPNTTTNARVIKHEVLDDDSLGLPPTKRRRVDGAPLVGPLAPRARVDHHHQSTSTSRVNHSGAHGRSTRPPHYPYSSPYTVDGRVSSGNARGPHPTSAPRPSSSGYGVPLPGRGGSATNQARANGSGGGPRQEKWEDGVDASMDEGERDAEGDDADMDAEGEIEDDEIQVLAHHPAPPLPPPVHYRVSRTVDGGPSGACSYTNTMDRRGAPPSHRYAPPPPHPHPQAGFPPGFADLDSPHGRRAFIAHSIFYLFSTTYEPTDELPIASLLAYVNAAMPVDKYEEFDTGEVSRWVGMGSKESGKDGREGWRLEGDVVRIGRW